MRKERNVSFDCVGVVVLQPGCSVCVGGCSSAGGPSTRLAGRRRYGDELYVELGVFLMVDMCWTCVVLYMCCVMVCTSWVGAHVSACHRPSQGSSRVSVPVSRSKRLYHVFFGFAMWPWSIAYCIKQVWSNSWVHYSWATWLKSIFLYWKYFLW